MTQIQKLFNFVNGQLQRSGATDALDAAREDWKEMRAQERNYI